VMIVTGGPGYRPRHRIPSRATSSSPTRMVENADPADLRDIEIVGRAIRAQLTARTSDRHQSGLGRCSPQNFGTRRRQPWRSPRPS
jgi:hypothetical protein